MEIFFRLGDTTFSIFGGRKVICVGVVSILTVVLSNEATKNVFSKFPSAQFVVNILIVCPVMGFITTMNKSMFQFLLVEELS
jgi:hypothetical protein